jgi:fatty acid desaturase
MKPTARDYSLIGRDSAEAEANGLAAAEWYSCPIDRKVLKELMKRSDGPALRDTAIWIGALLLSAAGGIYFWGSWWAVPFFLVYGVLYGSASDSRWHEAGHGTAFKTRWMNDVVYAIGSFMILREPTVWRWSHTRHHTDTIIVGRDPEIAVPRPPDILGILLNFFALKSAVNLFKQLFMHAGGRLSDEEKTYVPEMERGKVYLVARIYLAIYAAVAIIACLMMGSILPAMLIGLPSLYGGFMTPFLRADPACRPGGGCARPPAEQPHGLHEPAIPLPLLEHELSRRTSHVSDGALSRAAPVACCDQGGLPDALSQHHCCLSRDHSGLAQAGTRAGMVRGARTAGGGQASTLQSRDGAQAGRMK